MPGHWEGDLLTGTRLCDDNLIMIIGKGGRGDPHRYWLNPMMLALVGNKAAYDEVNKRIEADPALVAAANAAAEPFLQAFASAMARR